MNYDGIRDRHLNVFVQYDSKSYLENNITKAFINTLSSLGDEEFNAIAECLFDVVIPKGNITKQFYLQKKPPLDLVKQFEAQNRKVFAFSPTGESWGIRGIDSNDIDLIREELIKMTKMEKTSLTEEDVEPALKEILESNSDRGSIPDAWLFIFVDGKPFMVFAMENKLYNLNPYQIRNHVEKSLLISSGALKPIYKKYEDIVKCFKEYKTYMTDQFVEYMIILGYSKIDDFSIACNADMEDRWFRQELLLKGNFGHEILKIFGDDLDYRHRYTPRCHVDYPYLKEINLCFEENEILLYLSFGSTQNSAKIMLNRIDSINIDDNRLLRYDSGFHCQYARGRIIRDSYTMANVNLNKYISFWKKNIDQLKMKSTDETIELYRKILAEGYSDKESTERILRRLSNKKSNIYVIPEISIVWRWTYNEAAKLGVFGLQKQLKDVVNISLKEMKII